MTEKELKKLRSEAMGIAKDLGYPDSVRDRIKEAKSEIEISNILTTARRSFD